MPGALNVNWNPPPFVSGPLSNKVPGLTVGVPLVTVCVPVPSCLQTTGRPTATVSVAGSKKLSRIETVFGGGVVVELSFEQDSIIAVNKKMQIEKIKRIGLIEFLLFDTIAAKQPVRLVREGNVHLPLFPGPPDC